MNRWILTVIFFFFIGFLKAQDIEAVFTEMPDRYLPYLETEWRKDLMGLKKQGKEAKLKNTMEGISELKELTDNYLLLESTSRSTVQLKLLPLVNNTKIICMVVTVSAPVPDSRICFFTTEWKPLDVSKMINLPKWTDFFKRSSKKKDIEKLFGCLDLDLFSYQISAKDLLLQVRYTTPEYVSESQKEKLKDQLTKEPILYKWNMARFEKIKK